MHCFVTNTSFKGMLFLYPRAETREKTNELKIWLDNVHCHGNEPGLQFCSSTGAEDSTCFFVAYGICTGGTSHIGYFVGALLETERVPRFTYTHHLF